MKSDDSFNSVCPPSLSLHSGNVASRVFQVEFSVMDLDYGSPLYFHVLLAFFFTFIHIFLLEYRVFRHLFFFLKEVGLKMWFKFFLPPQGLELLSCPRTMGLKKGAFVILALLSW